MIAPTPIQQYTINMILRNTKANITSMRTTVEKPQIVTPKCMFKQSVCFVSKFNVMPKIESEDEILPGCEQWLLDQTVEATQCLAAFASPPPVSCSSATLSSPPPSSPPSCCYAPTFIFHFIPKEEKK